MTAPMSDERWEEIERSTYRYTVWHNNVGRPVFWDNPNGTVFRYEGRSGLSPGNLREWLRCVEEFGAAITVPWDAPNVYNHRMIGVGCGHSDVDWCESRFEEGSMAAYYENDDRRGPWWEDDSWYSARKYYDPEWEKETRHVRGV